MEGQAPAFFKYAKDAQLDWISPTALWAAENADARIRLMAEQNTRALSGVDRSGRPAGRPPRSR